MKNIYELLLNCIHHMQPSKGIFQECYNNLQIKPYHFLRLKNKYFPEDLGRNMLLDFIWSHSFIQKQFPADAIWKKAFLQDFTKFPASDLSKAADFSTSALLMKQPLTWVFEKTVLHASCIHIVQGGITSLKRGVFVWESYLELLFLNVLFYKLME